MIGITADGIVCGTLARRLPEAERWDQTGWARSQRSAVGSSTDGRAIARGCDVEAQPGTAEAERRERRWQRLWERAEPVRPRDEAPNEECERKEQTPMLERQVRQRRSRQERGLVVERLERDSSMLSGKV